MRELRLTTTNPADEPNHGSACLDEQDVASLYANDDRPVPNDRPWVLVNMVTSLDGATAIDGVSGQLGGPGDRMVFRAVRALADVIIVAAGTAVAEDYGPARLSDDLIAARTARGQAPLPTIAVVTNALSIEPTARIFSAGHRPLIITSESAPAERMERLGELADFVVAGTESVDLSLAVGQLARRGHAVALVEGGPSLNGQFVSDDLFDELLLTFSPSLVAGSSKRMTVASQSNVRPMSLNRILVDGDHLFLRYLRDR
ncbi:MAG: pyrimidine reductase family protein [Acidimicrobiales bacterium]